jgi:hypothetical protein
MTRRKNRVEDILGEKDKRAGQTWGIGGILASLYRMILADWNIGTMEWGRLMHRYLNDPINTRRNKPGADQASTRANIAKELLDEQQTWKVFCKGLVFLRFSKVKITVELSRGSITKTHTIDVDFGLKEIKAPESEEQHEHISEKSRSAKREGSDE